MWKNIDQDRHYAGEFQIGTDNYSGEIVQNKENGVILLGLTKEIKGPGKSFGRLHHIVGKLNSGTIVTLYNCRCTTNTTHNFSLQDLRFRAEYMVWGKTDCINRSFNKFVCVIENGLQWSKLTQINSDDFTNISFRGLDLEHCYQWFGARINFSTHLDTNIWNAPRSEACKINERLQIEIETDEKHDINFFLQIRNKVTAMICFAIKDNINIENQYLCDYDDYYLLGGKVKQYYEYSVTTNEKYHYLGQPRVHKYNFYLDQLPKESNTADAFTKLEPVFNLYLSLFKYDDMPLEMVFLNIVQAIETFHSRFFYDNKKKKYIESVNSRFGTLDNFDKISKLLLSDTQMDENCNYIILVSRLNDLLIGKYDGLFYDYYGRDSAYAQRIADTRHYYTHYGKTKEAKALKGNDLLDAINILSLLLEYNICLVLGIDISKQIAIALSSILSYRQLDQYYESQCK